MVQLQGLYKEHGVTYRVGGKRASQTQRRTESRELQEPLGQTVSAVPGEHCSRDDPAPASACCIIHREPGWPSLGHMPPLAEAGLGT